MLTFLEPQVNCSYSESQVVILPIPYEVTTTYRRGCANGPSSILEASPQLELYDEELDWEISDDLKIHTYSPISDTRNNQLVAPETMLLETSDTIYQLVKDNKFVISLGGEHSITAGIIKGYLQAFGHEPLTVIQIDAHGDLRHEYEGTIHNHACVMRRILEMGLPTLQIGIRSISKEEALLIKEKNLSVFRARHIVNNPNWISEAINKITTKRVFITIDLDGIDPTLLPGVGTPEPGGLNWYSLTQFLRLVFENHEVIGCDVMELAPIIDSVVSQFTAAKLVYKLIGYKFFNYFQKPPL